MSRDILPHEQGILELRGANIGDLTAAFDHAMDTPIEEVSDSAGWPRLLQLSEFVLDRTVSIIRTGDTIETLDAADIVGTSVSNRRHILQETGVPLEDPYGLAFARQEAADKLLSVAYPHDSLGSEAMVLRSNNGAAAAMLCEALSHEGAPVPRAVLLNTIDADDSPNGLLQSLEDARMLIRIDQRGTRYREVLTGRGRDDPTHITEVFALARVHAERYEAQRSKLIKTPYTAAYSGGESALFRLEDQSFRIETQPDSFSVVWSTRTTREEFLALPELTDANSDITEEPGTNFIRYEIGDPEYPAIIMTWADINDDVPESERNGAYNAIGVLGSGARGRHYLERLLNKTVTPELKTKLEYFSRELDVLTAKL